MDEGRARPSRPSPPAPAAPGPALARLALLLLLLDAGVAGAGVQHYCGKVGESALPASLAVAGAGKTNRAS